MVELATTPPENLLCQHCMQPFASYAESIQRTKNGDFRIRGDCPKCMHWIKFIPYAESYTVRKILYLIYHERIDQITESVTIYDDVTEDIY